MVSTRSFICLFNLKDLKDWPRVPRQVWTFPMIAKDTKPTQINTYTIPHTNTSTYQPHLVTQLQKHNNIDSEVRWINATINNSLKASWASDCMEAALLRAAPGLGGVPGCREWEPVTATQQPWPVTQAAINSAPGNHAQCTHSPKMPLLEPRGRSWVCRPHSTGHKFWTVSWNLKHTLNGFAVHDAVFALWK